LIAEGQGDVDRKRCHEKLRGLTREREKLVDFQQTGRNHSHFTRGLKKFRAKARRASRTTGGEIKVLCRGLTNARKGDKKKVGGPETGYESLGIKSAKKSEPVWLLERCRRKRRRKKKKRRKRVWTSSVSCGERKKIYQW